MNIDLSPEALNDIVKIKEYVAEEFSESDADKAAKKILKDIRTLARFPESGTNELFKKFNIVTDYRYIVTAGNLAFYRIENDTVKVVRVLNQKMDVIYKLFGIKIVDDESDYWNE